MDFERARFNMVEQQIRPWDVLEQDVLDLLLATRREDFCSPEYRELAFSDLEVPIAVGGKPTGETMLAPKVEGRILQALALRKHESVLVVGAGAGYLTSLISYRARKVTALEIHPEIGKLAAKNLKHAGVSNVHLLIEDGAPWFKPTPAKPAAAKTSDDISSETAAERFDAIVFCGGLSILPEGLAERLTPGTGRAFVFLGEFPVMRAKLLHISAQKHLEGDTLFETSCTHLKNFPKAKAFKF
jgi:protein-L-isoaspartate(D-aspartate) O-methyltransferase